MNNKRLQILISAVNKKSDDMPGKMKIESDAIIVNQLIGDGTDMEPEGERSIGYDDMDVRIITKREKGVGLSRNTGIDNSDHELIQFGDDDIVYNEGYAGAIVDEFDAHPEADVLLFNVKAQPGRETYWNSDYSKVSWYNYGRYAAYAICLRRQKLIDSGVRFSLLFGGGAPYMNGEDSLFLHDCLKAGLNIYRTPVEIGQESPGESTWFKGYTDKFFFDRGVLYHFLYGKMAPVWGFRFLFKNRSTMCSEMGLFKAYKLLRDGIRHGSTI